MIKSEAFDILAERLASYLNDNEVQRYANHNQIKYCTVKGQSGTTFHVEIFFSFVDANRDEAYLSGSITTHDVPDFIPMVQNLKIKL